ncbi:MAG: DUF6798 domain-containing protein [Planctomycetaceae bacterium]
MSGRPAAVARWAVEAAVIAAIFAAAGAWPVPDVNEAVYLTKARHAADPTWAAGDFFLETPDAHGVFYRVFGPIAATLPLDQAAWVGRIAGWLALAIGFRHAVGPLVTTTLGRLAVAALFAVALRCTTMAGEWVIGGCESKVFAWACVFGGLGEFVRGRPASAWLAMGCGAAFHPIVGGWAMIALVPAWWLSRTLPVCGDDRLGGGASRVAGPRRLGPMLLELAPTPSPPSTWRLRDSASLVGGLVAAAAGVVPALGLSGGASAVERAEAARIYVVERLGHHLLPGAFGEPLVARHALAIVAWWLLARQATTTPARTRLGGFTLAALGLSVMGFFIAAAEPVAPATVHGLMRFYWFRLADVLVPLALAATTVAVLEDDAACLRLLPVRPAAVRWIVAILLAADLASQSAHWPLPGREPLPARADIKVDAESWVDVCNWVRLHAPPDARFLTPRGAASFTWRTDRPEVVSWKNSPQDARSLIEWRRRIVNVFSPSGQFGDMGSSVTALGPERIRDVAATYGATHAIVPVPFAWQPDLPFDRVYANAGYVVYRIDQP